MIGIGRDILQFSILHSTTNIDVVVDVVWSIVESGEWRVESGINIMFNNKHAEIINTGQTWTNKQRKTATTTLLNQ